MSSFELSVIPKNSFEIIKSLLSQLTSLKQFPDDEVLLFWILRMLQIEVYNLIVDVHLIKLR